MIFLMFFRFSYMRINVLKTFLRPSATSSTRITKAAITKPNKSSATYTPFCTRQPTGAAEFLRIDFPRIPFAEKREDFEALSRLGAELIEAHLLRKFPHRGLADYHGRGDNSVEKPRYVEAEQRVFINDAQSFAPVPKEVWEFHIGGYQVLDKYLKSRKGRKLSLDEINHVAAVADTLAFTIEQMERIDRDWAKAFPDRG